MTAQKLKEGTRVQHEEVEKQMYADEIFNKTLTSAQYKQLIITNYIFHALLEDTISAALPQNIQSQIQIDKRRKLPALEADIKELQLSVPFDTEIPVPEIHNSNQALGVLYVMEGATLGGNVIVKHLKQTPGFNSVQFHYYGIYQEQTGPYWKSFTDCINQSVTDDNACVQSAVDAFDLLKTILGNIKKADI